MSRRTSTHLKGAVVVTWLHDREEEEDEERTRVRAVCFLAVVKE
jgi:hypothetical protein